MHAKATSVCVLVCAALACFTLACATLQPAPVPEETAAAGRASATRRQPAAAAEQEPAPLPEPDRTIEVVAERFLFTPSVITVQVGTTLEIRLTSEDTDHGFRIVGADDIDVAIPKRGRGETTVIFVADEPGEYRFECSRICGAGHNYMRGVIRVTTAPASSSAATSAPTGRRPGTGR